MARRVRLTFYFGLVVTLSATSQAQQWELGAQFGLAASHDPSISGPLGSAHTGFPVKAIAGVVWARIYTSISVENFGTCFAGAVHTLPLTLHVPT